MRNLFLTAILLLVAVNTAAGQDDIPFKEEYSIEIGTGVAPLHTSLGPSWTYEEALAKQGQTLTTSDAMYPTFDITGAVRSAKHHEFTLSVGVSWIHHKVFQHSRFGIDPNGNPRYNINDKTFSGWADTPPVFSFTVQWRYLWNPEDKVSLYSGLGLGYVSNQFDSLFLPLPSVTPVALRIAGKHFYGFAELMVGPMATLAHGGLGWKF